MTKRLTKKKRVRLGGWLVPVIDSMKWLPEISKRLARAKGVSEAELFRVAFCEHYAKEDAELADMLSKWKEIVGR